jgi:hypothetical protein
MALRSTKAASSNETLMATARARAGGLTLEQLALFNAGFLQWSDGSLMRWSPNQEQSQSDPLVTGFKGLQIKDSGTKN